MSDKARELATSVRSCSSYDDVAFYSSFDESAAFIDAALLTARLEAIEECKAAVETWASSKVMIHVAVLLETLDALKEEPDADAN